MRCYACHQPVGANARFCSICGAALAYANPATPTPVQQPIAAETVYATPTPLSYAPTSGQLGQQRQLSYAPASGQPRQPAQRRGAAPFMPVPADEFYLPAPPSYEMPAGVPFAYAAPAALPATYAPAPATAPVSGPSMVNNVMVTQVTPPPPTPAPALRLSWWMRAAAAPASCCAPCSSCSRAASSARYGLSLG